MHALLVRSGVSDVTYATLRHTRCKSSAGARSKRQCGSSIRRQDKRSRSILWRCWSRGDHRRAEAPTMDLDRDARVESLQLHMADAFADDARSNRRAGSGVEVFRRDAEDARAGQRELDDRGRARDVATRLQPGILQNTRRHAASSSTRRACESRATRREGRAQRHVRARRLVGEETACKSLSQIGDGARRRGARDIAERLASTARRARCHATSICSSRNPRCSQRRLHQSTPSFAEAKVHPDHHIQVARAHLLGADDVSRQARARAPRFEDGANLSRDGADQNASAIRARRGRAMDPHDYTLQANRSTRFATSMRAEEESARARRARRNLRRAFARWSTSMVRRCALRTR